MSVVAKAKGKIFYGWYMVAAGLVLNATISGILSKGFTSLVNPMATTFGWSYAVISLAQSLRGAESGVFNPFMGRLVDRYSLKWLVLIGTCIVGAGYLMLASINNLPMLFISFTVIALGSSLGGNMAPTTAIARWFKKDVGKANGIIAFGIGIGGFAVPMLTWLIDSYGWQTALIIVGIGVWVTSVPLAFVFRNRPEDYGLIPDGREATAAEKSRRLPTQDFDVDVKVAVKSLAFWQMGIADMLQMAGYGAWALHVVPYLISLGMDRGAAAMVALVPNIISLPMRFVYGWLTDIIANKYATSLYMALSGIGLIIFSYLNINSFAMIAVYVVVAGLAMAGMVPLRAPRVRQYFGTKNFGSLFGLHNIFTSVASVAGPPLAGLVFDLRGTYDPIWLIMGIATLLSMVMMLTMPLPSTSPRKLLPFW